MKHQAIKDVDQASAADALRAILKNCEDEPIRIPGSIQRHGFLLLLDQQNATVVAASENAEEFLHIPLKLILGAALESILEREVLAVIQGLSRSHEHEGQVTYLGSFPMRKELYSVVTHLVEDQRVLEFEEISRLVSPELMNAVITNFVGKLSKLPGELALCAAITRQVKDLTGFNRVLLYRFDEAGHGTVLTEENDGTLPICLDLRFPASDIPKQARELYVLNTVRTIPNALYIPSPLSGAAGRPMRTFDLSFSTLRSVSPIHLEYMRNMGTMASMSISLVREGRLWGLISCHHAEPRSVPYIVRSACDLLTKMVGTQLIAFRSATQLETAVHFHGVQRKFLTQMAADNDYVAVMTAGINDLVKVTNAEGAALIIDGQCQLAGKTPSEAAVLRLAEWMKERPELQMLESSRLGEKIEWASEIAGVASGLLVVRISDVRESYLLWFRPEVVSTVKWAGEPIKTRDQERALHPRASFETWQEMVRGQSEPWTEMEVQSAEEFRTAIMTISLKRAEEAVELSEARFQQLTHSIPNLVWAANDEGKLTYVNQRWREMGLGDEGSWYVQAKFSAEDQRKCKENWRVSVMNGSSLEVEIQIQEGNENTEQWNLVRAVPFRRANGTRAGWVGTFTDLTERRGREMALRMTEKLALTGRMTSVIAHEINNPLEAIINIHYLLGEEVRGNNPALAYIAMAESELERISGITKQTLRWSKESAQKEGSFLAGSIFDDVLRIFEGKIRNRELDVAVSGRDTQIFGVISQLQQVLSNLLANAVDAAPLNGHIWLSAASGESGTEIVVSDDGSGISEEIQRHMFEPFYSTKGTSVMASGFTFHKR
jgi:light-regulated signal transduction histidine kinase (bacteriophytochrome)